MSKKFHGIEEDLKHGITPTGNIIRDAWVFGIIPETETCSGWTMEGIDRLYDEVTTAWSPFGHLVSNLPDDLRARHRRIYDTAVATARRHGWDPELGEDD
jgi:hypothetical protein